MTKVVLLGILLCINATWTARVNLETTTGKGTGTGTVADGVTLSDGSPIVILVFMFNYIYLISTI